MIDRPEIGASAKEVENYVRNWVRLAAREGFGRALEELNSNIEVPWSIELFDQLTFDHYSDGERCEITDPDDVPELRINVYEYDDGSGYHVDHDLALNRQWSDFTAQFVFKRNGKEWSIILHDIHVM